MSVEMLPLEMLQNIFKYFDTGTDLLQCREVCERWKEAVDGLSDDIWKKMCKEKYLYTYEDAYRKAKLSWKDLFKALESWSMIEAAEIKGRKLELNTPENAECVQFQFQIVKPDMIGVTEYRHKESMNKKLIGFGNSIAYYNLETLQEIKRDEFDFYFSNYKENDNFIGVIDKKGKLCIVTKKNNERFFVGKLDMYGNSEFGHYELLKDEVYFKTRKDTFSVSKFDDEEDENVLYTYPLGDCELYESLLAIRYIDKNRLLMLTAEVNAFNVHTFRLSDEEYATVDKLDGYCFVPGEVAHHGFNWASQSIFSSIRSIFHSNMKGITKLKGMSAVFLHGNILMIGTKQGLLHIYYSPDEELLVTNRKPIKTIDLKQLFKINSCSQEIVQIDAVDMVNGHRVIVLVSQQVYILEFKHTLNNLMK